MLQDVVRLSQDTRPLHIRSVVILLELTMPEYHAHSANDEGQRHGLVEHLRAVAELAREFSSPFGGGETAHYAGLWHDLGKFDPEFQRYLSGGRPRGPDHKGAGTRLACKHLGPGGLLVQGHHGGLRARRHLKGWADEKGATGAATKALETARRLIPELEPHHQVEFPDFVKRDPVKAELWLRMVFSALVDADFLDAERHFNPGRAALRSSDPDMAQLWDRFQTRRRESVRGAYGPVNALRSEVYDDCRLAAVERPPGVFRLTVPTGGGKTLSALGFALRHASAHGLRRIVTATPFMSITQQTAEVYREFLEQDANTEPSVVLEHHSMADMNEDEEYERGQVWSRLAAENWDAPVVVTTTVQLFHSLFSNRTSSTRKLHRLAQSVIILDEAQTLPPKLLEPILDMLRELTENYGASVVLSTATQPAFETIKPFANVPAAEIVPGYSRHFQALKRVKYEWKTEPALSWQAAADLMRESPQTLAVVNTKRDALALLEALEDESALHLSTLLCGRHRQRVIQDIRSRLDQGQVCRVVSTQVVEAGVDLDFPMVMRAVGPFDSIIQAAGRCNRSGRLDLGRVVVFRPETGSTPPGDYRFATDETLSMLSAGRLDPDNPETVSEFFQRIFDVKDTDAQQIQQFRKALDYPEVAKRFRMIDEATIAVIVPDYGTPEERQRVQASLEQLRKGAPESRFLLRRLQPWTVQVYETQAGSLDRAGLIAEVMPGVYEWLGDYSPVTGIGGITTLDPDRLIV